MTAEIDLLPLYAELQGHPKIEIIKHYARANVAHAIVDKDAEIDALRTRLGDTVRDSTNKIEALLAEVGELHMHAKRRDQYAAEKAAQALDCKKRAERLAEALREAADMLLADYPETAKRLRAALHPAAATQESRNG